MKIRKIKYRWPKNMGYPDEARLCGPNGRKRGYGHYRAEYNTDRSRKEIRNSEDRRKNERGEELE